MCGDCCRIQTCQNSYATKNSLSQYSNNLESSHFSQSTMSLSQNYKHQSKSIQKQNKGKQAISKFNPSMQGSLWLIWSWGVRTWSAFGPGGTSQTGASNSHRAAGHHNRRLSEDHEIGQPFKCRPGYNLTHGAEPMSKPRFSSGVAP